MSTRSMAFNGLLVAIFTLPCRAAAEPATREVLSGYLAGNCTNCHGTQGRSPGAMPSLAGLPQGYLVEQMKQFREGTRPATIMHEIAKGYTDQQTALLGDYFARQPKENGK